MKFSTGLLISFFLALFCFSSCLNHNTSEKYTGIPYIDSIRSFDIQSVPGRIQCEFFDKGGNMISYYDSDLNNNGSGSLNKGEGYLMNFRINEAPDISFTKFHDSIDNSSFNLVKPENEQLYLGWTEPGEWTKYTVDVTKSGEYKIGAMYTSNRGGTVQIYVNDTDSTGPISIQSTFHPDDSISWRQWHHWNYVDSLGTLQLKKGENVLKFVIEEEGNFNFDYLNFTRID